MINSYVRQIFEQTDPDRQLSLARKLRILLLDALSKDDRDQATRQGITLPDNANALRQIDD